jgi:antitoxin YefM
MSENGKKQQIGLVRYHPALYGLPNRIALVNRLQNPIGKRNHAVFISAEDWSSIQETLYLLSVPGMHEYISRLRML